LAIFDHANQSDFYSFRVYLEDGGNAGKIELEIVFLRDAPGITEVFRKVAEVDDIGG